MKKNVCVLLGLVFVSSLSLFSQNAPITIMPNILVENGATASVHVRVIDFDSIGSVSLTLNYDTNVLVFQSSSVNAGFPGFSINASVAGTILAGGFASYGSGNSLADSSVLFSLEFTFLGGFSGLVWNDDGSSCEYAGPSPDFLTLNDSPQEFFYPNGSVTSFPIPGNAGQISGPLDGYVCEGQTDVIFSVTPIENATEYIWILPEGASITNGENSNEINVAFSSTASNGSFLVYGSNPYGVGGISPPFPVIVNSSPEIISQPASPEPVLAGEGMAIFNVIAQGSALHFQWQEFTSGWNNLIDNEIYSGSTTDSLAITNPPISMNGFRYRCVITGFCLPVTYTDGMALLTVYETVGLNNLPTSKNCFKISAFPNPCLDLITLKFFAIRSGAYEIELSNILGIPLTMFEYTAIREGYHEQTIKTGELSPGFYIATLQYSTENIITRSTVKFFKAK